ncbi:hypothetical protein ABEB36_008457 [Hypothenemus hampei]|uniref:Sulfatase N-terminal domain-containing protein n=1 Tax=Hypothenemus hampei TaxID=57062 RepID=A0ABD1ELX9_HYPHA
MKHRKQINGKLKPWLQLIYLLALCKITVCDNSLKRKKPNIILFLTDDQDIELGSLQYMPKTTGHLQKHGIEFQRAYVTTPMCCPSRSSLLTGMYVHNHEVYTNKDNCSSPQWQATHETKTFATYLSNAGYRTGYFGKYLNKYNGTYIPPGWREWGGLIMNSKYYNYSLNMNGQTIKHGFDYEKDYYTDVVTRDAINFIRNSKKQYPNKPIMMVMAFPAPHGPEDSAPKYSQLFFNTTSHHTPAYNFAPNPDKQWILQVTGQMQNFHKEFTDLLMTKRLQTLQSVDDAVEEVVNELEYLKELNDTYLFYTSDHGYHLGQFGLIKGKSFPFEFDVRVPFLLRGPGIEAGKSLNEIVLNIDLAPTFLDLAGVKAPSQMDGRSILPLIFNKNNKKIKWKDTFLIESSGRRETPHLQTKQHESNLLQYSVPRNSDLPLNYTDFNNALVRWFKNDLKHLRPNSNEDIKINDNNDGNDFLLNNMVTHKVTSQKTIRRLDRNKLKCIFGNKLACRHKQKLICRTDSAKWRNYKCREEKNTNGNEKPCICFTSEGPIFPSYWLKNKQPLSMNQSKNEHKYCHCANDEEEETFKLEPRVDLNEEEKIRLKKQKKREEICHHERMTCFEHNNDHWRTAPKWTGGSFCFCMNANNNTYSCLRTINNSHNFLYCEFTTGFVTFYNLRLEMFTWRK